MNLIDQILNYVNQFNESYNNWVVGITNDPIRRYKEHNSPSLWKHWNCLSEINAKLIEKYLLYLGFDGATGGGEKDTVFVYVFRK